MRARVHHARVVETHPAVSDLQSIVKSYERIDRFLGTTPPPPARETAG